MFCQQRDLRRLSQAQAEALPFAAGSFAVLTALDVLEHLDDEEKALGEWHRVLQPGGHLVVSVPAYEFLWSGEDFVSAHRRRYRRGELRNRLETSGFAIDRVTYLNAALFPAVAGTIVFRRLFNPRSLYRSNLEPLPRWLNELLTGIFCLEASVLTRINVPFGSSIFCVARRRDRPLAPDASGSSQRGRA
jgi:SAM-dependent methyltransferase